LHNVPDKSNDASYEIKYIHYLISSGTAKIGEINFELLAQTDLEDYANYYYQQSQNYSNIEKTVFKLIATKPIYSSEAFM